MTTRPFSGSRIRDARTEFGWTQAKLADLLGMDANYLSKFERGERTFDEELAKKIATIFNLSLEYFRENSTLQSDCRNSKYEEIVDVLEGAAIAAAQAGWQTVLRPGLFGPVVTKDSKITGTTKKLDPTSPLDRVTADAMQAYVAYHAEMDGHPLFRNYGIVDEEDGCICPTNASQGDVEYAIVCDSADDTAAYEKDLAGMNLIGCYRKGVGWVAAAALDFKRLKVFAWVRGCPGVAATRLIAGETTRGSAPQLIKGGACRVGPTGRKELAGSSINIYLGKPQRIIDTARIGNRLLTEGGIKEIHSYGGSRGPLLVADGLLDSATEFAKGFKCLDFAPGLLIARSAGCWVNDLDGRPINLDVSTEFEHAVFDPDVPNRGELIEKNRQTFAVTASEELNAEIRKLLA